MGALKPRGISDCLRLPTHYEKPLSFPSSPSSVEISPIALTCFNRLGAVLPAWEIAIQTHRLHHQGHSVPHFPSPLVLVIFLAGGGLGSALTWGPNLGQSLGGTWHNGGPKLGWGLGCTQHNGAPISGTPGSTVMHVVLNIFTTSGSVWILPTFQSWVQGGKGVPCPSSSWGRRCSPEPSPSLPDRGTAVA